MMPNTAHASIAAAFAAALAVTSGTAAAASANDDDRIDLNAMNAATITMTQAIGKAEADAKGRAASASVVNKAGRPAYEVHLVLADGAMTSVIVDGTTGQVAPDPGDAAENESGDEPEDAE